MGPKRSRGGATATRNKAPERSGGACPPPVPPLRRSQRKRAPSRAWLEASEAEAGRPTRRPRRSPSPPEAPNRGRVNTRVRDRPQGRRTGPRAVSTPIDSDEEDWMDRESSISGLTGSTTSSQAGRASRVQAKKKGKASEGRKEVANRLLSVIMDTLDDGPPKRRGGSPVSTSSQDEDDISNSTDRGTHHSTHHVAARRRPKPRRRGSRMDRSRLDEHTEDPSGWGKSPCPRGRQPQSRRRRAKRGDATSHHHTRFSDRHTAHRVWGKTGRGKRTGHGKRKRASPLDSSEDTSTLSSDSAEVDSDNPLPPGLPDTPLSMHMTQALKRKIWRGAYVDMFTLLLPAKSKKERAKEEKKGSGDTKEPKMDTGILSWAYAFLAYHSVVVEKDVQRTHEMIPYMNLILKAYHEFGGSAWRQYDESFRRYAAHHRDWPWDRKHPDLWLQATQQSAIPAEGRTPTGHLLLARPREAALPRPGFGGGGTGSGQKGGPGNSFRNTAFCYEYGAKGTCARPQCRFKHACALCNGRHPASTCFRSKGTGPKEAGPAPKHQQGGTPGKGPNSH